MKRSLPMPYERCDWVRSEIRDDIWQNFWNNEQGHFTTTLGGKHLDASIMLLMPLVRFVSSTDPEWIATLYAIKDNLVSDVLMRRYTVDTTADALKGGEGSFAACLFWYVECLARAGRVHEAYFEFEKLLSYANPLGLYAEEFTSHGNALDNIPQALTHLALISATFSSTVNSAAK